MKQQQDHWLVRPRTIKILWIMFSVVLALLVGADFFVAHHPHLAWMAYRAFQQFSALYLA